MIKLKRLSLGVLITLALAGAAVAVPRAWDGTSGYWTNETKWGGTVPLADDTVTLPVGGYTVTLDSATADLTSYTQNGGVLFFTNWDTCLRATVVTINSGKLDHAICDTNAALGVTNRVYIVGSNVTIGALASINVTGRGFPGSNNDGMGPGGGDYYCWGGSYGGLGGRGHLLTGVSTPGYGVPHAPVDPGSGGGGGGGANIGAAGGGAVRIDATGTVKVDGTVSTLGATATASRGGGGSGGSINLSCLVFEGTGLLDARGGNSGTSTYGGGGGGGRIAITFDPAAQSNAGPATAYRVLLEGGRGVIGKGAPGTLFLSEPQNLPVPASKNVILHFGVNPVAFVVSSLSVTNFILGFGDANVGLTVAGDLLVASSNGLGGLSFSDRSALHVGGNLTVTNAFLTMASQPLISAELTCASNMLMRDARVEGKTFSITGDLTIVSPGGTNGLILTNNPALTVGGNILLMTNAFIRLHSWTNTTALLTCLGSMKLDGAVLSTVSAPTGVLNEACSALVAVKGDLTLMNNAWVIPSLTDSRNTNNNAGQALFRMRNLIISTNSGFNGNGLGYAGLADGSTNNGYGPGGGYYYAGGAGYGGTGGLGHASIGPRYGRAPYGNSNAPVQPGSGGAGAGGNGTGGAGGGSVVIEAARTVSVDGTITVNGVNGDRRGGGGSGGGIFVTCVTLAGAGTLSANGGSTTNGAPVYGGGGGGGRIAVGRAIHAYSGSTSVSTGMNAYAAGTPGPGTVVWLDLPYPREGALIILR